MGPSKAKNMAIKINLLPDAYAKERKRNTAIAGMVGLVAATGLGIGLLYASEKKYLEKVKTDLDNATVVANQTAAAKSATDAANTATASVKGVVDFMTDASKSGRERAALLDLMRRYIYRRAVVSEMDLTDGKVAKISVTVESTEQYARFLLALRQGATGLSGGGNAQGAGKVFDGVPKASGVPGFPSGRPIPQVPELSDTPQPIQFPFPIRADGIIKADAANARNNLTYVPVEPPGTLIAATSGAGAGGPGAPGSSALGSSAMAPPSSAPAPVPAPSAAPN